MAHVHDTRSELPSAWQALVFGIKASVLRGRRALMDWDEPVRRHQPASRAQGLKVLSEQRSLLWNHESAAEFPLTAGKVENLRVAARDLHRVTVPGGEVWSFWKQLGRATRTKGYVTGRELREGCLVPAVAGGLCQLSGLIYQAALEAGLQVVERHGHSRVIAGSLAEQNKDATVFWNYVDLRLCAAQEWSMEVELSASELVVRILSDRTVSAPVQEPAASRELAPPSGDCLTCGMVECFRHPSAVSKHAPAQGHSAYLLDARWPEFERWCAEHSRDGDRWLTPMDGARWRKPNYHWSAPKGIRVNHATLTTLWRSWRQRRLPQQGALRQRSLLKGADDLARAYVAGLSPHCRHVVVAQNLLPFVWQSGALGGRSFDVLMERWPLEELQRRLDEALAAHPASPTLGDFRTDEALAQAESEALAAAGRIITPHRAIARHFGSKAWLVEWDLPEPLKRQPAERKTVFFPCSRLARKGAFELAEALRGLDGVELKYLGRAEEGVAGLFDGVKCSKGEAGDLKQAHLLILPAWVEHQPRLALRALASGIPVIATTACGLPEHEQLHLMDKPDGAALRKLVRSLLEIG